LQWRAWKEFADLMQVISVDHVFEPGGAGLGGYRVAFKILEVVDGRGLVDHDALRVVLHGSGNGEKEEGRSPLHSRT